MKIIGADTEYDDYVPFIATTCNQKLETTLYDLKNRVDKKYFKMICESTVIDKVFHAITNDIYALSNIGIKVVPPYECTMIAASLIDENFERKKLKSLAARLLGEPCLEAELLTKVKAKYKKIIEKQGKVFKWSDIPAEILEPYAKMDPYYAIKLWYLFSNEIKKYQTLYDFEKSLVPIIVSMMKKGMRVNRAFVRDKIVECEKLQNEVYEKLCDIVDENDVATLEVITRKIKKTKTIEQLFEKFVEKNEDCKLVDIAYDEETNIVTATYKLRFSPGSGPQVLKVLDALGIVILEETDKGATSTEASVLEKYKDAHPFIELLLDYRYYDKQLTTYYRPLLYDYTSDKDDIAHFPLYSSGAKTGRFTAELIQTFPKVD